MSLDQVQIETLVKRVLARLDGEQTPSSRESRPPQVQSPGFGRRGVFSDLNLAVEAANAAYPAWVSLRLDQRKKIIEKLREGLRGCLQWMSEEAVEETGLGR